MIKDKPPSPLDALDRSLAKARASQKTGQGRNGDNPRTSMSGVGLALRIGVEMVSALAVGTGIGVLVDKWLETTPWGMVIFFILGATAGILNVYRAVSGIGLAPGYKAKTPNRADKEQKD